MTTEGGGLTRSSASGIIFDRKSDRSLNCVKAKNKHRPPRVLPTSGPHLAAVPTFTTMTLSKVCAALALIAFAGFATSTPAQFFGESVPLLPVEGSFPLPTPPHTHTRARHTCGSFYVAHPVQDDQLGECLHSLLSACACGCSHLRAPPARPHNQLPRRGGLAQGRACVPVPPIRDGTTRRSALAHGHLVDGPFFFEPFAPCDVFTIDPAHICREIWTNR